MAYATRQDLERLALPGFALTELYPQVENEEGDLVENPDLAATIDDALTAASSVMDSYLSARFIMPIITWGEDLRRCCTIIAAYDLMTVRGHAPMGPDENLRLRYLDLLKWLADIAAGKIHPIVEDSSEAEDAIGGGPSIGTDPPRGW